MKQINYTKVSLVSLFSALIIAGAYIRLPFIVPITGQTLFVYFACLVLGPTNSFLCVFVYLFLGLIGLPVFTSGAGLAALIGPTGGFLLAMLVSAPVMSLIAFIKKDKASIILDLIALLIGTIIIYVLGTLWFLYRVPRYSLLQALSITCFPFLIGDFIKIGLALYLSQCFKQKVVQRLN